ncbi:1,4-dihydroxy-2-naphthoate polyprenyltransferase [Janibacter sp. G56]|uniref:1,4-dihydroxy-2-naphthoate polyprenyltransferase n=1 Tax=Janibacter sp. G56 TaxID=3418717 RepID=UPI003D042EE6
MASTSQWIAGARPRTFPAAIAPVLVGTAAAEELGRMDLGLALLALLVSLSLQVAVNYANDYSDGIRGTDEERVGPVRLVGQGLARPSDVKLAAYTAFGVAALAGLALVALSGALIFIPLGALAMVAAWRYTGGDNPYGYRGLGEIYVFVFFGLMATLGTQWTQADALSWEGVLGAVGVGALASAILVANNLRDIPTDRENDKITLAVRLGDARTRQLYLALLGGAVVCGLVIAIAHPWVLASLLAAVVAVPAVRAIRGGATGRALVPVLASTGLIQLVWAILVAAGLLPGEPPVVAH